MEAAAEFAKNEKFEKRFVGRVVFFVICDVIKTNA